MNNYEQQKAMRKGKYKAFYCTFNQHEYINQMLKEITQLTLEQINDMYPSVRKLLLNITERDILILALRNHLDSLRRKKNDKAVQNTFDKHNSI
tara:strand:+ start:76 stop:357 length:282 start_codon:yes stop_codon:yes gene_type:complete